MNYQQKRQEKMEFKKKDNSDAYMSFKTIPRAISEARRKASFSLTEAHGAIVVPIFIDKLEFSAIYHLSF